MTANPSKDPSGAMGASGLIANLNQFLQTLTEQMESLQDTSVPRRSGMPASGIPASGITSSGVSRSGQFNLPGGGRGVYGFSIRSGLGGSAPVVNEFGNVKMTNEGVVVSETREPLVDVFDEGDEILVVVELPGVAEADIHVELNGDVLAIEAQGKRHRYGSETLLPATVEAGSAQQSYENGYLQVRYRKSQSEDALDD
jgi:HSP20 family protein